MKRFFILCLVFCFLGLHLTKGKSTESRSNELSRKIAPKESDEVIEITDNETRPEHLIDNSKANHPPKPTTKPTDAPTTAHTTNEPPATPTTEPTTRPTTAPPTRPTTEPTTRPTTAPPTRPTTEPTTRPTFPPTTTTEPTTEPPTITTSTAPTTQPTTDQPVTDTPDENKNKLGSGAVTGIIVAVLSLVAVIGALLYYRATRNAS